MTFDAVMKRYNGVWENGRAVIQAEGGYYWVVAEGTPEKYELTLDGRRYVGQPEVVETPTPEPAEPVRRTRTRKIVPVEE